MGTKEAIPSLVIDRGATNVLLGRWVSMKWSYTNGVQKSACNSMLAFNSREHSRHKCPELRMPCMRCLMLGGLGRAMRTLIVVVVPSAVLPPFLLSRGAASIEPAG
ncbi:hypothetical protein ACM43_26370 [Bradyrhizobium sp. CCBAU 45321]|nr:hypothetical protein [Bradyrhizobium sp. CCBAU 45321]